MCYSLFIKCLFAVMSCQFLYQYSFIHLVIHPLVKIPLQVETLVLVTSHPQSTWRVKKASVHCLTCCYLTFEMPHSLFTAASKLHVGSTCEHSSANPALRASNTPLLFMHSNPGCRMQVNSRNSLSGIRKTLRLYSCCKML